MVDARNNWFERHPRIAYFFVFIVFFSILEIVFRLLAGAGVFQYQLYPTRWQQVRRPVFLDDINPSFGVWHYPNATARHRSSCFDVTYISNSHGMRDPKRAYTSNAPKRVVVLGDSYVEGLGVEYSKRMTDLLEQWTGIEHLNFGTSGSFGSIQQMMLYKDLGLKFDHSDVFIFTLPFNDFGDNNPEEFPATRYRPYLRKEGNNWQVYYPVAFTPPAQRRETQLLSWGKSLRNGFNNVCYTANFLRTAIRGVKKRLQGADEQLVPASYNTFSESDLEILLYTYKEIARLAYPRQVTVFTIPVDRDYLHYEKDGYNFKLAAELTKFSTQIENLNYIDLLPGTVDILAGKNKDYSSLVLPCDGHWNDAGHEAAASVVMKEYYHMP